MYKNEMMLIKTIYEGWLKNVENIKDNEIIIKYTEFKLYTKRTTRERERESYLRTAKKKRATSILFGQYCPVMFLLLK